MARVIPELLAVALLGALGGALWALTVLLLVTVFTVASGGAASNPADALGWLPVAAFPVMASGFVWYAARARPGLPLPRYQYGEGVAWGLCAVAVLALFGLVSSTSSFERGFLVAYGVLALLVSLPALLTVAPLTLWAWVRAVSRLRAGSSA